MHVPLAPTHYEFAPSPRSQVTRRTGLTGRAVHNNFGKGQKVTPRQKKRKINVQPVPKFYDEDGKELSPRQMLARQLGVRATPLGAAVRPHVHESPRRSKDGQSTNRTTSRNPNKLVEAAADRPDSKISQDDRALASALRVNDSQMQAIGTRCTP